MFCQPSAELFFTSPPAMAFSFKSTVIARSIFTGPTCSVCVEPFDEDKHIPRILQCAHTICETCVFLLEEQSRQTNRLIHPDQGIVCVRCPTCRTFTQSPRASIRTNFQLMDVVDKVREEQQHRISFLRCTSCNVIYHERDMNLCAKCSPFNEKTTAQMLLEEEARLDCHALCSTCLLKEHVVKKHNHIRLQPLRVEMQRIENFRRILIHQDNLHKAQRLFRERLDQIVENWSRWNVHHEEKFDQFHQATDSFHQKTVFDSLVKQFLYKIDQLKEIGENVLKWSQDLEKNGSISELNSEEMPARPDTPIMVVPQDNNLPPVFYF